MIRFESITKQYPGSSRPAVSDIDLEVLRGEFVFLVGASGSGKSTCLRLVLKEEQPTAGRMQVMGQDLGRISPRKIPYFRRNIGVVFQDFRLLPNKTVFQNIAFSLQVIGKSRGFIQEAVPDVLDMVGLEGKGKRMPHELSGGEQQRVAIARAAVNRPQILLADEPTGNLDPATSAGIMVVLERIAASGTTVMMATHEAGIVDQMQKRVIELSNGEIVRDERHGGYGVTAVIPVQRPAEETEREYRHERELVDAALGHHVGDDATSEHVEVRMPTGAITLPADEESRSASRGWEFDEELDRGPAAASPRPATPWEFDEDLEARGAGDERGERDDSAAEPSRPAAPSLLTRPATERPEQLGLAARLGLRDDDETMTDDDQDVGPVR